MGQPGAKPTFGNLKARDVIPTLRAEGFEKGVETCLTKLAEYQSVVREAQIDIATAIAQMTDIVSNFTVVAENMRDTINTIQRKDSEVSDDEINH